MESKRTSLAEGDDVGLLLGIKQGEDYGTFEEMQGEQSEMEAELGCVRYEIMGGE